MLSIFNILKEVLEPTQEYQELVNDIVDQGGEFLGEGDYGAVFLVGDKVKINNPEFIADKETSTRRKASWLAGEREAGRTGGLD